MPPAPRATRAKQPAGKKTTSTIPRGAKQRALLTVERLKQAYPEAHTELSHGDPFQLLVATILSAQTTDARVNQVTPKLFATFPDAKALAQAPLPEVEEIIKPTGFFRAKSKAIVSMAQDLVQRYGGTVPPRMEDLVTLPGVGRKTANVVLGAGFGVPGFAVDTHVARLTHRLGLTTADDPVKIEADVTSMVPKEEWSDLSLRLILHGRRVCLARRPRCEKCLLNDFCPSAFTFGPTAKAAKQSTTGSGRSRQKPKTAAKKSPSTRRAQ